MSPCKRKVIYTYLKSWKTWNKRWTEEKNESYTKPFNLNKILNIKKEKNELTIREKFLLVRDISDFKGNIWNAKKWIEQRQKKYNA